MKGFRLAKVKHKRNEATEIVYVGCDQGFDLYLAKLVTAIGPRVSWCSEEQFCRVMGYRFGELEQELKQDWIQHFPELVIQGEDVPGPLPYVLYRERGNEQTVRVFSASAELAEGIKEPEVMLQ